MITGVTGWRRRENREAPINAERPSCWVRGRGPYNHTCGRPRWGWTNHMEPLCQDHFRQRQVIQELLIMMSGCGNWGRLIVTSNPEGFKPYQEE